MLRPPIRRKDGGFAVRLGADEAALVARLLGELRQLLTDDDPAAVALTRRLFPVANPDDPEREAEYQRLMRDELVSSRVASIDTVEQALADDRLLDEAELTALMRSINSLRLVLGTMLDIDDENGDDENGSGPASDSPEHHLYGYLSWLLEHAVHALSGRA
ncbi:MAG: DUF2017 family protein [Ilumatobacteraceae bacterium]